MKILGLFMSLASCLFLGAISQAGFQGEPPAWAYDAGPSVNTEMGKELIELNANIPYFPGVSKNVMGSQKFRPAFGPISWRMLQEPNSVKILFIGQDGTHIAEAAGRPATAGFGGRAHDLANHFGVDYSAAFINTYAFTIRGQYGARGVPYLKNGRINFTSQYLDNELWLMSQGQDSPVVQWRNNLIDWIIRNNKKSLKLIVTFGGSARDTISTYVNSKENGRVIPRLKWEDLKRIRMPEFKLQYAGGNNNFPTPLNRKGRDVYQELLGKLDYTDANDQRRAQDALRNNMDVVKNEMVFSNGGVDGSGLLTPAQLGGYDISRIEIKRDNGTYAAKTYKGFVSNSSRIASLEGLQLNDGSVIENDVLVVDLPHPTYLSMVKMEPGGSSKVNRLVNEKTSGLAAWATQGNWSIEPDHGIRSNFFKNPTSEDSYVYGRGEIGQEYYDFGTPGNRMVSKSSAKRIDPESILLGVRDDEYISKWGPGKRIIDKMKEDRAAESIDPTEMFISISSTDDSRNDFDPGPGLELAKIMKESLYGPGEQNLREIFKRKSTVSVSKVGDFGHYRGRADNAKVLVLADPHGWDGIITARALTGTRGQHLQGLIANGITEDDWSEAQFILKTVPFGMDGAPGEAGATPQQWNDVLELTQNYREQVLKYVLDASDVQLVLTDGEHAKAAMEQFLNDNPIYRGKAPIVNVRRTGDHAQDMIDAQTLISENGIKTQGMSFRGRRANIPSSHLSYYARVWEGTSKDRVFTSGSAPGLAFAEVVPSWVVKQRFKMSKSTWNGINKIEEILYESCLPKPGEKPQKFLARKASGDMPAKCN